MLGNVVKTPRDIGFFRGIGNVRAYSRFGFQKKKKI
jgi:hypothetical protein